MCAYEVGGGGGGGTINVNATVDISGQTFRLWQGSGHNGVYIVNRSGNQEVVVNASGQLAVEATVTASAEISGQTVSIWQGSGHNGVFLTNQSGTLFGIIDASGRLAVTNSGVSVNVVSGTGVRISGETVAVTSGTGVRISGETISVTSGTGVRVSGETITFPSGIGVRISGETVVATLSVTGEDISGGTVYLAAQEVSGTFPNLYVTQSGKAVSGIPHRLVVAFSGDVVSVVSGTGVRISGETVNVTSGTGVRISGESITFPSGIGVRISGETVVATLAVTGEDISGGTVRLTALEVSGTFPNLYVTQSGKAVSGIPHRLVVAFSGDVVSVISGTGVRVSGETVSVTSGTGVRVSGETVTAKISGESVRFGASGFSYSQLQAYDYTNNAWVDVAADESGVVSTAASVSAEISGDVVHLAALEVSGTYPNLYVTQSGKAVSGIPHRLVVAFSGDVVSVISGTGVRVSGETISVTSGTGVRVSGETVSTSISGNQIRFGTSGFSYSQLQAYDYTNSAWVDVAADESGVVSTAASVSAEISGDVVHLAALEVSGTYPNLYVTQSGKAVSGIPHRLVVAFSGDVVSVISGTGVRISGETVSVTSGTGVRVSGETVSTSISGNQIRFGTSGFSYSQLQAYDYTNSAWVDVAADESGVVSTAASVSAEISGDVVHLATLEVSGTYPNLYVTQSGKAVSGIPHRLVVAFSGDVVSVISGTGVRVSGETVSVTSGTGVRVSGETVTAKISGESVRFGASGFSYSQLQAYDYTNSAWVDVAADESGVVSTAASVSAEISGDVVHLAALEVSGTYPNLYVTQSGKAVSGIPHRLVVAFSGDVVNVVSGTGVRVSGETITFPSGIGVRISGETVVATLAVTGEDISGGTVYLAAQEVSGTFPNIYVTQSGKAVSGIPHRLVVAFSGDVVSVISGTGVRVSGETVAVTSGTGVRVSGETITFPSGIGVRISGETVVATLSVTGEDISGGTVYLAATEVSGTFPNLYVTQSGKAVSGIPHRLVVAFSGDVVSVISGTGVRVSGETVAVTSGTGVRVSGETITFPSGIGVRISGETVVATLSVTGEDISGGTVYLAATEVSGTFPNLYVTQSGKAVSGIPHRLVVAFSGDVVNVISGTGVRVSGETVSVTSGTGVRVSGESITFPSGIGVRISGETVVASLAITGEDISGGTVYLAAAEVSGTFPNIYVTQSGKAVSGIPHRLVVAFSGDVVNVISGTGVRVSGETVSVTSGTGVRVSGESITFPSGIGVRISGETVVASLAITGEDISGGTVYLAATEVSGTFPNIYVTQSGKAVSGIPHRLVVAFSGDVVNVISGTGVRVSGETVSVTSGTGVRVSGETVNVTSGTGVRVSGETVNVTSGTGVRISGETVVVGSANVSGSTVRLSALEVSGTFPNVYVTQSGKAVSGIPHRLVVAFSGDVVNVISGTGVRISGETVAVTSGTGVRVSGETVSAIDFIRDYSGASNVQPAVHTSGSRRIQVANDPLNIRTRTSLLITGASGGVALLSGDSFAVTVRNIGVSGTVMFVGSSGNPPWVASGQSYPMFSGFGMWIRDGDAVTVPCPDANMDRVKVVSHTSGQRIAYLGVQYRVGGVV